MTARSESANLGGRPLKYPTPELMQSAIDSYFETTKIFSISELALQLGFCDRHAFYEYEKKPRFKHTIKAARARLTAFYERGMIGSDFNTTGCIFMAKQFGYTDKQEIDQHIDANVKGKIQVEFIRSQPDASDK